MKVDLFCVEIFSGTGRNGTDIVFVLFGINRANLRHKSTLKSYCNKNHSIGHISFETSIVKIYNRVSSC